MRQQRTRPTGSTTTARLTLSTERRVDPDLTAIERRAYDLFVARGREDGHDLDDWLQAESEQREGRSAPPAGPHLADIQSGRTPATRARTRAGQPS